ncbi:uncharacterized protein METZ01_LOCUS240940, partial [marine metagenome]
ARFFTAHHAGAEIQPDGSDGRGLHHFGASPRYRRTAHFIAPCTQKRGAADADTRRCAVRLPIRRHATGRDYLRLSRPRQFDGARHPKHRFAGHSDGGAHLLRRRTRLKHGGRRALCRAQSETEERM